MKLRIKFYYISVGYQASAALVFALMGKLPHALFAVFFAIMSWYGGEYWVKQYEEENNKQDK